MDVTKFYRYIPSPAAHETFRDYIARSWPAALRKCNSNNDTARAQQCLWCQSSESRNVAMKDKHGCCGRYQKNFFANKTV